MPRTALLALVFLPFSSHLSAQIAANDTRASASELVVEEPDRCLPLRGNTAEGSPSVAEPGCATPAEDGARRDLWYYLVADGPSVTVLLDAIDGNVGTVWVEMTTESGERLFCGSTTIWRAQRLRLDDLAAGDTVYVQVAALNPSSFTAFDICAFATPTCEPPQNISMTTGQNWMQLTWINGDGSFAFNGGRNYRVVGGTGPFVPGFDEPAFTVDGSRSPLTIWGLEPGEFYRIAVSELCSDSDQSIYARPSQNSGQKPAGSPPNDSLSATIPGDGPEFISSVSVGCFGRPGTTRSATGEDDSPSACGGEADDDVWYAIRPQGPQYRFLLTPAPGIASDLVMEIRDADLELLACVNEEPGGSTEVFDAYELTPDEDYYIRVYTAEAEEVADFEICAFRLDRPVVSDTGCTDALSVTLDGTGEPGEFVDVLTQTGEIVVSIENTQDLGNVEVSYFGASDSARVVPTDSVPVYYARNNVTIDPERQPADSVTVRFYLSPGDLIGLANLGALQNAEVLAIPNQPTGAGGSSSGGGGGGRSRSGTIAVRFPADEEPDVAVARVPAARCSADYPAGGFVASVVGSGPHGNGVYLDVRVNGFSDFFFSSARQPLTREEAPPVSSTRKPLAAVGAWPNPSTGSLTVRWSDEGSGESISRWWLVDAAGRTVGADRLPGHSAGGATLALPDLPAGLYTLLLGADSGQAVARGRVALR